jgi:hypothetical protein
MTPGLAVMLFGVFVVPALLLWGGHKLRRRPPAWRGAFWGAVIGHLVAMVVGSIAGMVPAAEWSATDTWRGVFGFWSFTLAPITGALLGWWRARRAT